MTLPDAPTPALADPELVLAPVMARAGGGGVSVGPGWYALVAALDRDLAVVDPGYALFQCKEKFGGLRYYWDPSDPALREEGERLVRAAEALAGRTCEQCGGPGSADVSRRWIVTLCGPCRDADRARRAGS